MYDQLHTRVGSQVQEHDSTEVRASSWMKGGLKLEGFPVVSPSTFFLFERFPLTPSLKICTQLGASCERSPIKSQPEYEALLTILEAKVQSESIWEAHFEVPRPST